MKMTPRALVVLASLSFAAAHEVSAQDGASDVTSGSPEEGPQDSGPESEPGAAVVAAMRREIELHRVLAEKLRSGADGGELGRLRADLEEAERARSALQEEPGAGSRPAASAAASAPSAEPGAAARTGRWWSLIAPPPRESWPLLSAVGMALVLWLVGARGVRRRLAALRSRLSERHAVEGDPRWRQAERLLVALVSGVILTGFVTFLVIGTGLWSGVLVVYAAAVALFLWLGRHAMDDAVRGLGLLSRDSYQVGDLVEIAQRSGVVESIDLYATTLRDLEGGVLVVPHHLVRDVRNSTYDWARAVIEVPVPHDEDVDRVLSVLLEVAAALTKSPEYADMVLEGPTMLGVESIAPSNVLIKFFVRTKARRRGLVKRELLRRIKKRFRELGIEAPLPPRRLHHKIDRPQGGAAGSRGTQDPTGD